MTDLQQWGILLGLLGALTFTVQNFWLRELLRREGLWKYLFYINLAPALLGVVTWLWWPPEWSWALLRGAALSSIPGMLGMIALGLALRHGDFSHVGPIIGSKALVVTLCAAVLGFEPTSPGLWAASGLLLVALFLAAGNREVLRRPWTLVEPALVFALGFCVFYGVCDLITRKQMSDHKLGPWDFMTVTWGLRAIAAGLIAVPRSLVARERVLPLRASALWLTAPLVALHGIVFTAALKFTDSAVLVNVLVSIRGLVAVLAVLVLTWLKIGRHEKLTRPVVAARLAGGALVCLAVWLGVQSAPAAQSKPAPEKPPPAAAGAAALTVEPAAQPP